MNALAARTAPPRRPRVGRPRHATPALVVAYVILGLFVAAAILGPVLAPYDPNQTDLPGALQGPSAEHLLGTDRYGLFTGIEVAESADLSLQVDFGDLRFKEAGKTKPVVDFHQLAFLHQDLPDTGT